MTSSTTGTSSRRTFLGIPIEGDVQSGDRRVPQKPLEELAPLLQAVIEDEEITAIGWTQYTPYFNDGDPCVFSVGEPWFATKGTKQPDDDEWDHYELQIGYSGHPTLGKRDYEYAGDFPRRVKVNLEYEGPDEARYNRCAAFEEAINSGAYEDVMLEAFGDHATVIIRRSGITVDSYEHD